MPTQEAGAPTADQLRTFLKHLHTPERLDTPEIRALLAAHRRLPPVLTPNAVGAAGAELLTDKIAALEAPADAPVPQRLPHLILETCFLRGHKSFQAAVELGLSERQVSRERSRALRLLAAELTPPSSGAALRQPLPSIEGHVRRDELLRGLHEAVATHRLVAVTGAAGAGKSSLVVALAHALGPEDVWWHRIRPGINDSLEALLYELGHVLAREGFGELRNHFVETRAEPNVRVATRLALEGLTGKRRLLVLDDFGTVGERRAIGSFLEEVVDRLPLVSVITIGGVVGEAEVFDVPGFTGAETAQLLRSQRPAISNEFVEELQRLSHGNPQMLAAVAAWWRGEARGLPALERHLEGRGALANLAQVIRFAQRGAA